MNKSYGQVYTKYGYHTQNVTFLRIFGKIYAIFNRTRPPEKVFAMLKFKLLVIF